MTSHKKEAVRVRFAPSPTGHWHLGGVRTTLFNWLFARQNKGSFILRIEDTDTERSRREYETEILEMLEWLGLNYDEGPEPPKDLNLKPSTKFGSASGGKTSAFGPYRQSERLPLYEKYLSKLLEEHKAYYCYCTKEELEAERQVLLSQGLPAKYGGHCRNLSAPPAGKKPEVIRFKTPEVIVEFKDMIRGKVSFDAALFGDFVIAKDIHAPLYNFAVVVDDHEMQISHVIRGEEHLSNTPKQILMQKALGLNEPTYAHLPLILAPDRSKLSKRYAETSLLEYREKGYLPEAILNFLAFLGWHPSHNEEVLSLEDLVKQFDISRVQKAGAIFNEEKLLWLNREHMRKISEETLSNLLEPFLRKKGITPDSKILHELIRLEKGRMRTLAEFPESTKFFFKLPEYPPGLLLWKDDSSPLEIQIILSKLREKLAVIPKENFNQITITNAIADCIAEKGRGNVLWPFRAALSGRKASPDPLDIATILGSEETTRRLAHAIQKLESLS